MVTTVTDNSPQSINTSLFSLDRDVQEIKKVTDKLKDISLESDVISVNGKRGIVELNASDVGALPDTTVIPTKTSELTNDSGFITSSDSITGNAATATRAEQDANGNNIANTYMPKSGGTFTGIVTGNEFHARSFFPEDNIDSQIYFRPDVNGETELIISGYKSLNLDSSEGDIFLKSIKEENALNKVVAKSYKVCTVNATTGLETTVTGANLTDYQKKVLKKIFGALLLGKCLNIRIAAVYYIGSTRQFVIGDIIGYVEPSSGYTGTEKDGVTIKIDNSGNSLCNYCYLGTIDENGGFVSHDVNYLLDKICKGDFSIIREIRVYATIMENWV